MILPFLACSPPSSSSASSICPRNNGFLLQPRILPRFTKLRSGSTDIYAYFLTHSTEFLDSGGRLGFITSDRWLDTRYGTDLQEFILDNYRVEAIIKFGRQAFEDALVGSCVLILSREPNADARNHHVAKFVRINESIDIDEIESIVEDDTEPDQMIRTEDYRLVTRKQHALRDEETWSVFFNAPAIYFDATGSGNFTYLDEVAEVSRGFTSGANDFYFGRMDEWKDLGLEEYTEPLLKATGQVERIRFDILSAGTFDTL